MTRQLETAFAELGLTHYLGAFIDQGFDTWEIILDIQESDLDALGVKLGHRRKLQRRIANARGIAPSVSLPSPLKPTSEDGKPEGARPEPARPETHEHTGVAKRKYRRHPKSDENAPERPPSAYVLFSNKMREDLKTQNLTFTEIAKLVGENWQSLAPAEKEVYETHANSAKEKYHRDMVEYKKTSDYRRYAHYLHDFKEKQAKQNQAHEAAKRPKLDSGRGRHGSTSSSATPTGTNSSRSGSGSGSGSGSEMLKGSEPALSRQDSDESTISMADSSTSSLQLPARRLADHAGRSTGDTQSEVNSPRESMHRHARHSSWRENEATGESRHPKLPSLSDMLEEGGIGNSASSTSESNAYASGMAAGASHPWQGPSARQSGRAPLLRHGPSSCGSSGSGNSVTSYTRTPGEGPLPIHALLSDRPIAPEPALFDRKPPAAALASLADHGHRPFAQVHGTSGYGFEAASSAFQHMRVEHNADGDTLMTSAVQRPNAPQSDKSAFDGMSALLRAGEIVGRRQGE